MIRVPHIVNCARCGSNHDDLDFAELEVLFAPPEANGKTWTHWAPCPTNGQPIMLMTDAEPAPGDVFHRHGKPVE